MSDETATRSEQYSATETVSGSNAKPSLRQLSFLATTSLTPAPHNPRKHSRAQVRAIAKSIEAFGFNAPVLVPMIAGPEGGPSSDMQRYEGYAG
jgi:hypothetical protein